MRFLTTNLLNLARRDDGIKPELAEVPTSFFNTTFTNYEMIASENDRVFRFENRIHRTIVTDQLLLKQLMTILFDNAVKYTEEDGEIDFVISATDRNLYLLVSDNGVGISAEDKKKIFDRFYRVDKARTRQKGGFGLGLSLAKQIVDALKGTITVKDNKPKGTIFEVKIAIQTPSKKKNKNIAPVGAIFWIYLFSFRLMIERWIFRTSSWIRLLRQRQEQLIILMLKR